MKTKITFDAIKEVEKEIEVTAIVGVLQYVKFHFKDGKVRKAKCEDCRTLTMTVVNGEVKFNRKLIFYEDKF